MPKFKPGDVVIYSRDDAKFGIGIIDRVGRNSVYFDRHCEDRVWYGTGCWETSGCELHPDPDAVWADYCAWRLTHV